MGKKPIQKRASVATVISDKIDLKEKKIRKKRNYVMVRR